MPNTSEETAQESLRRTVGEHKRPIAYGSAVFCAECGNILPVSTGNRKTILKCDCCGHENEDVGTRSSIRVSKPSDYPSPLRNRLKGYQQINVRDIDIRPTVSETCPECGRKEVKYTNLQLRSADEGTTTFYFCDCGHRWRQDN